MPAFSYEELVERLTVQHANINQYAADVMATAQEIADIENDRANLAYIKAYVETLDADKRTVTQIKQAIFNGDENVGIPPLPPVEPGGFPNSPKAGAFQRFMERRKRWKTAPAYTHEVGTALGLDASHAKPAERSVEPRIKAAGAVSGHRFSIAVSERGEAKMWDVFVLRKGGEWTKVETCSGRKAEISVPLSDPERAEQVQVRVQLRKNNANYGQPSEIVYVTLNP